MDGTGQIEGFIAKLGVKYRILMPYEGKGRVLLRFQVAKDASLYLFDQQPKKVFYGQATIRAGSTQTTVDVNQGNFLDDSSTLKSEHLSFHGSGVVKSSTGRAIGHPLRRLTDGGQVCTVIFPHLSKLPAVKNLRESDIKINYPVDEACPLAVNITAAPRSKVPDVRVPAPFQWSYAFVYEHLLEKDDLVLILHFYHSPGEWPIAKITVHPTDIRQFKTNVVQSLTTDGAGS